jgi:hypothetical protein
VLSIKKLALVFTYVALFFFVVDNVRASEVPRFVKLTLAMAAVAALATILEYRFKVNLFYTGARALLPPGVSLPDGAVATGADGRLDVTGPTRHGLAASTMFAMALPFAVVAIVGARRRLARAGYAVAVFLLVAGGLCTLRRAGVVLPVVGLLALTLVGGRSLLPAAAVAAAMMALVPIVAPDAARQVADALAGRNAAIGNSTAARTSDYSVIAPDIRHRTLVGRGLGSYSGNDRYIILDNAYLGLLVETGVIGVAAYAAMVAAAAMTALRVSRRALAGREILLATWASIIAFFVSGVLFDVVGFPHAPYFFFILAGFVAVCRAATPARAAAPQGGSLPTLAPRAS